MKKLLAHFAFAKWTPIFCLLFLPVASFAQDKTSPENSSPNKASSVKVLQLLDGSGYSYSKVKDDVWSIPFHGKALPDFEVKVVNADGMAVIYVIVAGKTQLRVTPELMRSLLQMNDEADRVKIAIDKEGKLLVRTDVAIRVMDVQELKDNVEQVAAVADEITKLAKPTAVGTKPR